MLGPEAQEDGAPLRNLHRPPPSCCLMFLLFSWGDEYSCSSACQSSSRNLVIKQLSMETTISRVKQMCVLLPFLRHMRNLQGVDTAKPLFKIQYLW